MQEELLKHGEWHGEKDNKIIISNKKLVELIQKLDSTTPQDFVSNSKCKNEGILESEKRSGNFTQNTGKVREFKTIFIWEKSDKS